MKGAPVEEKTVIPKKWTSGVSLFLDIGSIHSARKALDLESGKVFCVESVQLRSAGNIIEELLASLHTLARLNHRHLQRYIGFQHNEDIEAGIHTLHIFSDLVLGQSIQSLLEQLGALPDNVICRYIYQILRGLEYLHRKGFAHGWITARNVFITQRGSLKLVNFWVSPRLANEMIKHNILAPIPPENLKRCRNLQHWDAVSIGALAIHMALFDESVDFDMHDSMTAQAPVHYSFGALPQEKLKRLAGSNGGLRDFVWCCGEAGERAPESIASLLNHPYMQQINTPPKAGQKSHFSSSKKKFIMQQNLELKTEKKAAQFSPEPSKQGRKMEDLPTPVINLATDRRFQPEETSLTGSNLKEAANIQIESKEKDQKKKDLTIQQAAFLRTLSRKKSSSSPKNTLSNQSSASPNSNDPSHSSNMLRQLRGESMNGEDGIQKRHKGYLVMQQRKKISSMIADLQIVPKK